MGYKAIDRLHPNNSDFKTTWRPSQILRVRDRETSDVMYEFRFPHGVRSWGFNRAVRGGWVHTADVAVLDRLPKGQSSGIATFAISGSAGIRAQSKTATIVDVVLGRVGPLDIGRRIVEVDGHAAARELYDLIEWYLEGGVPPGSSRRNLGRIADEAVRNYLTDLLSSKPGDLILTYIDLDWPRAEQSPSLIEWQVHPNNYPSFSKTSTLRLDYSFNFSGIPYKTDVDFQEFVQKSAKSWMQAARDWVRAAQETVEQAKKLVRSAYGWVAGVVQMAIDFARAAINVVVGAIETFDNIIRAAGKLGAAVIGVGAEAIRAVGGATASLISAPREAWKAMVNAKRDVESAWTEMGHAIDQAIDAYKSGDGGGSHNRTYAHIQNFQQLRYELGDLDAELGTLMVSPKNRFSRVDRVRPDDTIEQVASRNGITAAQLISLNNLSAPYIVSSRKRPVEMTGKVRVLFPGDPIKVSTPGLGSAQYSADDGRTMGITEQLFRTDFELDGGGWKIQSGKPKTLSGPRRIVNRIEEWDFVVSPGSSISNPAFGSQLNAVVGSWSDASTLQRVVPLAVDQTLRNNPYVAKVLSVEVRREQPGTINFQGDIALIDGSSMNFAA